MDQIVQFFDKLVTEFTWKRLAFIACLFMIALSCVAIFELYTNHFRFSRIERGVTILDQFNTHATENAEQHRETVRQIEQTLLKDLEGAVSGYPKSIWLPSWLIKVFAAVVPWIAIGIAILFTDKADAWRAIGGVALCAIPSVMIAILLPDFQNQWINYALYPFAYFVLLAVIVMFVIYRQAKALARQHLNPPKNKA